MRSSSGTVLVHFSMVKLPEKPMMPRLADARVGYFTTSTMDYSRPEHRAEARQFVARWRLEKKDPTAAVSEPVKPHRLLPGSGHAQEVGAVSEEGHRELAVGL